jgi:hypothetical protein
MYPSVIGRGPSRLVVGGAEGGFCDGGVERGGGDSGFFSDI